jgi:hypothetical protein
MNRVEEIQTNNEINPFETKWRGLWSLEYNQNQDRFHIQEADISFQSNMQSYVSQEMDSWVTMGVFNSFNECQEYNDWVQNLKKIE